MYFNNDHLVLGTHAPRYYGGAVRLVKNVAGVKVTTVDTENNTIATDNATFVNQQSIFRLSFRYKKPDESKTPITAKSLTITIAKWWLKLMLIKAAIWRIR